MINKKKIEKLIDRSIIEGGEFNNIELYSLLNSMTTDEILNFWVFYSAKKAFREATIRIPDWETKRQSKYFQERASLYQFYPEEKDVNGKYIIDRSKYISHVAGHLTNIINEEIEANLEFKNKSLLEKIPAYSIKTVFILIPVILICFIFQKWLSKIILVACGIVYLICILAYMLSSAINKKHRV